MERKTERKKYHNFLFAVNWLCDAQKEKELSAWLEEHSVALSLSLSFSETFGQF